MTDADATHTGGCLCGQVRYRIRGPLRGVVACHCSQCRRTSGHFAAMTSSPSTNLALTCGDGLVWYRSSDSTQRGFCGRCGSNLFWKQDGSDAVSITAGTLDLPTRLAMERHIFVEDKSDYYSIDDEVPKQPRW